MLRMTAYGDEPPLPLGQITARKRTWVEGQAKIGT